MGEKLFTPFRGLYWSLKLRIVDYEPETQALDLLVPSGGTCLDVGGNFGQFAAFLSRAVGPHGQVHNFEPLPYNREILQVTLHRLGCSNVELHPYAVGDENRPAGVAVPGSNTGEAYLVKPDEGFPVKMITLDEWVETAGLARIDFIKVDVEGFEFFVLRGAERVLYKFHPTILCEITTACRERYGHSPDDPFEFLRNLGYSPFIWQGRRLVPCDAPTDSVINYFFIHSSRPLHLGGAPKQ